MTDPHDLQRFVRAQDWAATYEHALAELRAGRKRGHWMWFVLPQVAGLGRSSTAQTYAVSGLAEARSYLAHPVLGRRLVECAEALDALDETDAEQVLGSIDAVKLRSSMTLFEAAAAGGSDAAHGVFGRVLEHYFGGQRDDATLDILGLHR